MRVMQGRDGRQRPDDFAAEVHAVTCVTATNVTYLKSVKPSLTDLF